MDTIVDKRRRTGMILYCCQEHVDMALDEVVYECETYPQLTSITDQEQMTPICGYCRNQSIYMVSN